MLGSDSVVWVAGRTGTTVTSSVILLASSPASDPLYRLRSFTESALSPLNEGARLAFALTTFSLLTPFSAFPSASVLPTRDEEDRAGLRLRARSAVRSCRRRTKNVKTLMVQIEMNDQAMRIDAFSGRWECVLKISVRTACSLVCRNQ